MPILLGIAVVAGVVGLSTRSVLDGISDTTDRVTPNLIGLAGIASLGAAGFIVYKVAVKK